MINERKLNRLSGYNYSKNGWYFVTIDCLNMREWFGKIVDGEVNLNDCGLFANHYWKNIVNVYQNVVLDEYIIMPNHIHGIVRIVDDVVVGTGQWPVRTERIGLLSKIVNGYKNAVTKNIRFGLGKGDFAWQRSFYDEIIRSELMLKNIRKYIIENPVRYK
jgi:putative transposase